jgi:hypothetical protein
VDSRVIENAVSIREVDVFSEEFKDIGKKLGKSRKGRRVYTENTEGRA